MSKKTKRNYVDLETMVPVPLKPYVAKRVKIGPKSAKRDQVTDELKKLMPQAEVYVAPKAPMSYVKAHLGSKAKRVKGFIVRGAART